MNIDFDKIWFLDASDTIEYKKELENWNKIFFNVNLYTQKFKEYQKKLFDEFYTKVLETEENTSNFLDFKKKLENTIKEFNLQLKIFQEKISLEEKIEIKWNLQIFYKENYLSVLIWESSNIIFRNNKLEVVIPNEVEEEDKIDIFSEIIEWELESNDIIISIWCNIHNYMTNNEIKEIILNNNIKDNLIKILSVRIDEKEIWYIIIENIKFEKILVNTQKENYIKKAKENISKYKYPIWIILWFSVILFLVISIFSYMGQNKNKTINIWWEIITNNIDGLRRQIDAFSKLSNTNSKNAKQQYKSIMNELNTYQKNNIQVLEIKELKKQMEQNYYRWFHINIVGKNDWILNTIYTINKKEIWELSWLKQLIKTRNTFNIIWNKWAVLWIIDNKTRWILERINIPSNISTCSKNLSDNWVYCYTTNWNIYNISKYGLQSVSNSKGKWRNDIISLWTYWNNKLYTLNSKKGIERYVLNWRNKFWPPTVYNFSKKDKKSLVDSIFSGSKFAIDWTFLIWSKKWLIQAWRWSSMNTILSIREVKWWRTWIINKNEFQWNIKVISHMNSKYVYLYDYNTQSLTVYLTSPYKTNTAYTTSYNLIYKFKVKFDIAGETVKDVIVKENPSTQQTYVYILTNKKIYKMNLMQFSN